MLMVFAMSAKSASMHAHHAFSSSMTMGRHLNQLIILLSRRNDISCLFDIQGIHYNQLNDSLFCFTCIKIKRLGILQACANKIKDGFFVLKLHKLEGC